MLSAGHSAQRPSGHTAGSSVPPGVWWGLWGPGRVQQSAPDRHCSSLFTHVGAFRRILGYATSRPKQHGRANSCLTDFCNVVLKRNPSLLFLALK